VRIAVIATLANIVFSLTLMGPLSHGGLALATSLSAFLNFGLLMWALKTKLGFLGLGAMTASVSRSVLYSGFMGLIVWQVSAHTIPPGAGMAGLLLGILGSIVSGVACYVFFAYIGKSEELDSLLTIFRKKRGRGEDQS